MQKIGNIRSGGQTGVDRAALDFARSKNIPIKGWCPRGGWAEDKNTPPGILTDYPELKETPSKDPACRTIKNVEAADATLIIADDNSNGTKLTLQTALDIPKNHFVYSTQADETNLISWINSLPDKADLNIAGPRESESKGCYKNTLSLLDRVIGNKCLAN